MNKPQPADGIARQLTDDAVNDWQWNQPQGSPALPHPDDLKKYLLEKQLFDQGNEGQWMLPEAAMYQAVYELTPPPKE